jgi:hypothetical protein
MTTRCVRCSAESKARRLDAFPEHRRTFFPLKKEMLAEAQYHH